MKVTDTIAAIASAAGNSGIGIVRISGDDSLNILNKIFKPAKADKNILDVESHTLHYGHIYDGEEMIDEVMVLIMKAPNSYTTEDTVEIDCHGGSLVIRKILRTVIKYGARSAEPGEFTKRAFLNGRIDLSQAEAVMDVINSQSDLALKSSMNQLNGNIHDKITKLRNKIIYQIAFIESALDDPEHISLDGYSEKLLDVVVECKDEISKLISSFDNGKIIREGVKTAILGKPNAGKSSLMNLLVGEERAIVTEIAGTTRDTLSENIRIGDISLNVIDTAGIRETDDVVEKIGVKKAIDISSDCDLIIYVVDGLVDLDSNDMQIIDLIKNKKAIVLLNKADQDMIVSKEKLENLTGKKVIVISAKERTGFDDLIEEIKEMFYSGNISYNNEVYITNERHKEVLDNSFNSLCQVENSINDSMPEDFYSIDLMDAYESLGLIIGESVEDDLVNEIFSKFCMGK
ncbi:MAG: tRNA uridine-5-carboxymethylaminomethyl(34) synthesis GTPase MnmE [Lachnospiraceae bacterium]|nr:tRNA uridine-5-carboxymethylaminomethyl(34) synthesis GTPase MnmE [Lachnospiraceae bacterium]